MRVDEILKRMRRFLIIITSALILSSCSHADISAWKYQKEGLDIDVVKVNNPQKLKLFLNDQKNNFPYKEFKNLDKDLKQCEKMLFAMNAGMFHADYTPVGLYIENNEQLKSLNTKKKGFGNFLIQPNGVFLWDRLNAQILITDEYNKRKFDPTYATQSGPMLVINSEINKNFTQESDSLKIRNAVAMKGQSIYFVITNKPINFYNFANFLKKDLKVENALYLDGSISNAYIPSLNRYKQTRYVGPILAYIDDGACGTSD